MRRIVSFIIPAIIAVSVDAQGPQYLELVKAEEKLNRMFNRLYSDTLSDSEIVLAEIKELMPAVLETEGAMQYAWTKLDRIGVVLSEDKQVRIFTWHVSDDPDRYRYFGYIQIAHRRGGPRVYELVDNHKKQRNTEQAEQYVDNWYGKLYYRIVTKDYRRNRYYTLLGLDFNNIHSNIKTIEVIELHRHRPRFVPELFFNGRDRVNRVILEYSSQVSMTARYDSVLKMIAFDHLVPFHPVYSGNYEFYGPDGSFDGLEFVDGLWMLREDLDARNID